MIESFKQWIDALFKRAIDLAAATIGLVILWPLFAFIAVIIKYDSRGPTFYWSSRVGKNGRNFQMLKFRTMYENAESYKGPRITGKGDPRITPVGQWLRDTKLNELPQLWNVFKGDMSLVGPRPEDPSFVPRWPEEMQQLLLSVRPGMTSPASIVYRDEEEMLAIDNLEEAYLGDILPDKLRLDANYVREHSIFGDIDILFWTFIVLIPLLGKRQIPDDHLLWGPVRHFFSRYFSWFLVDIVVVFAVVTAAGLIWRSTGPLDVGLGMAFMVALAATLVFSLANYVLGLSRIYWSTAKSGYVLALFTSASLATLVLLIANQELPRPLPAMLLVIVGLFSWVGFVVVRYRLRLVTGAARHWLNMRPKTHVLGRRALIVGSGIVGQWAAKLVGESELLPTHNVVGFVDDSRRRYDAQIGGYRVLGKTKDIASLVKKFDIDLIVFAIVDCGDPDRQRILEQCHETSLPLIYLPDVVESIQERFNAVKLS